jgi:chemotaxis protein MotB
VKKKHPEHVNLERWLVSYADFITLLFAFFVIMYAISQADIVKFRKVSASIRAAFQGAGNAGMVDVGATGGGDTANQLETEEVPGGRALNMPAGKTHTAADPDPELQELREQLEETITLELGVSDVSEKLQMQYDSRGMIIRIATKGFFEEGEAVVRPELRPILDRMAKVLLKAKRLIRVEGHSDLSEIKTKSFSSDWELSAARAAWVTQYWVEKFNLDPKRLGAAGYSHYRPLDQGRGEWAKAKNRRVEIIILNNEYEVP